MNNMNMAGMSSAGGPVGGMPIMNNGTGGQRDDNPRDNDMFTQLNTYIYDYFLKNELYSCAESLLNSSVSLKTDGSNQRTSPGMRRDADGNVLRNGVDENAMDSGDSKNGSSAKRPDGLPDAKVPQDCPANSFLYDWWCVFWEMFGAQQRRGTRNGEGTAMAYMQHTQAQQRIRQEQQRYMLGHQPPQMMAGQMSQYQNQIMMRNMQNGMTMGQNDMARTAMQNSRKSTPSQMQLAQKHQIMQQQMNRGEGADMDMNGPRPQSPSSAENAPSPSKRPRLESGQFSGQPMVPNGRGQQQMQGQQVNNNAASAQQAHNLLIANGINPNQLTASQFNSFQQQNPGVQAKSIQVYAQNLAQHQRSALQSQTLPKGMPNTVGVPNHGSPMMQQGSESGANLGPVLDGFYTGNGASNMRSSMTPGGTGGSHALHDYQMQLMLLEQQNKKRLLMARQEQDNLSRSDQPGVGQPGFQGMSPQGSRAGPSPNPSDQMKRGTPKMNQPGLPGSPMPDGGISQAQPRNSPAAMGFGQGPEMNQGFYHQMKGLSDNIQNGNVGVSVMRPPSSHPPGFNAQQMNPQQLEQVTMTQRRTMNGNWPGQSQPGQAPMMAQHPQGPQAQQMGTPGQRNTMPPPQAPPAGNSNGRTQPSSPQQNQAPPTPQQAPKANPKGKKEGKEPRKPTRKKGSTANLNSAATPSSEPDPPPTPTPSTPITPQHASSFTGQKASNGPAQSGTNGQPAATAPAPASTLAPPQPDSSQVTAFPMDTTDQFNMEFGPLEGGDVLDQFDFDSFLNTDDNSSGPFVFDTGPLAYSQDGVEAGTGE